MTDRQSIAERISQVKSWYQRFEVVPGVFTPGCNDVAVICDQLRLPKDLTGMSVLDVGASEGGFSFECERRGASRVVAYDLPDWHVDHFALVKEILGSKVEYVKGTVYRLSPKELGTFDIVLFTGVLYHLRHPLLACDRLRWVSRKYCFIETHVMDDCVITPKGTHPLSDFGPQLASLPLCQFYERGELGNDTSNWFGPNIPCVLAWFRSAGFDIEHLASWGWRAGFRATVRPGEPPYYHTSSETIFLRNEDPCLL